MNLGAIEGVLVTPLRQIPDERGKVMHMMRAADTGFVGFGEIYFSIVYPGVVKAWHLHRRMTLNYAVVAGTVKLVLYDDRDGSPTRGLGMELFVGDGNYVRVTIPPGVWNGFRGVGVMPAVVANCADSPHDPDEIERMDPHSPTIPYNWELVWR